MMMMMMMLLLQNASYESQKICKPLSTRRKETFTLRRNRFGLFCSPKIHLVVPIEAVGQPRVSNQPNRYPNWHRDNFYVLRHVFWELLQPSEASFRQWRTGKRTGVQGRGRRGPTQRKASAKKKRRRFPGSEVTVFVGTGFKKPEFGDVRGIWVYDATAITLLGSLSITDWLSGLCQQRLGVWWAMTGWGRFLL